MSHRVLNRWTLRKTSRELYGSNDEKIKRKNASYIIEKIYRSSREWRARYLLPRSKDRTWEALCSTSPVVFPVMVRCPIFRPTTAGFFP
jgi:hypothetical protein